MIEFLHLFPRTALGNPEMGDRALVSVVFQESHMLFMSQVHGGASSAKVPSTGNKESSVRELHRRRTEGSWL